MRAQHLIIHNLEDEVMDRLRRRAEERGRSMEEEARDILRSVLLVEKRQTEGLGTWIAKRFAGAGIGLDHEIEEWRGYPARPALFDE